MRISSPGFAIAGTTSAPSTINRWPCFGVYRACATASARDRSSSGAIRAPATDPTAPPIKAPSHAFPPVAALIAAPRPAPPRPPTAAPFCEEVAHPVSVIVSNAARTRMPVTRLRFIAFSPCLADLFKGSSLNGLLQVPHRRRLLRTRRRCLCLCRTVLTRPRRWRLSVWRLSDAFRRAALRTRHRDAIFDPFYVVARFHNPQDPPPIGLVLHKPTESYNPVLTDLYMNVIQTLRLHFREIGR